ncbi:MAG: bifunctional metallophosphatase/5'-nucleotidase [Aerococcus urinaeequi]|nr:bifunctional metallophosphatase/5'-nucleotidase [Aerococcus urinaeequi]
MTIFQTSDIHGYLYPTNYLTREENQPFGLVKVVENYLREKDRLIEGSSILISTGDTIQGSPLTHYLQKRLNSAEAIVDTMNYLGYDMGVPGNHEFNYGQDYLLHSYKNAQFPILCANILNENGEPYFGKPYKIVERNGIKIAVLGLTTQYIPHWEHPDHIVGLQFKSAVEMAKVYMPMLSDLADVVVVAYHGGFECDLDTLEPVEQGAGENEGYALTHEVPGIDILLTGHQHNEMAQIVNGVAVVMPGDKGRALGKVTLTLNQYEGDNHWTLIDAVRELITTTVDTPIQKDMAKRLADLQADVEDWLDKPMGTISGNMRIDDVDLARIEGHPYIELMHRVQNYFGQTEITAGALFDNYAKGFPETVTVRDILNSYPFPNTLAVVKIAGAELKAAIEQSAEFFILDEDREIIMSKDWQDPTPKPYNYDMYEGIEYVIDVSQPIGQRVVKLNYHGEPLDLQAEFEVTLNQFRAIGGGGYHMFDSSKIIREVNLEMNELIAKYLEDHETIHATCNHNFQVVNGDECP